MTDQSSFGNQAPPPAMPTAPPTSPARRLPGTTPTGLPGTTPTAGTIITPEAVQLDFRLAGLASRSLSFALDFILAFLALLALSVVALGVGGGSGIAGIVLLLVGMILILVGYPAGMETLNNGRTVGRMATGTRVVTIEGSPIRFRHALVRALLGIIELYFTFGAIAVVVALLSKRGQRLGDLTAGTMVIRERTSKLRAHPQWYAPPFGQEQFVTTIDTTAVTGELYQTLRDFLARADELQPEARVSLADRLAVTIEPLVQSAMPPPGQSAEQYLQCVAAAATNEASMASSAGTGAPGMPSAPPPPAFGTGLSSGNRDFRGPLGAAPSAVQPDAVQPPPPNVPPAPDSPPAPGSPPPEPPSPPSPGGFAAPR